jgi:prepilin-type processing-associated H-X9-DG protein
MDAYLSLVKRNVVKKPSGRGILLDYQQRSLYPDTQHLDGVTRTDCAVYRHQGGLNLLFADGHVDYFKRDILLSNINPLFKNDP